MRKLLILDAEKTTVQEFADLVRGPILRLVRAGSVYYVWTDTEPSG